MTGGALVAIVILAATKKEVRQQGACNRWLLSEATAGRRLWLLRPLLWLRRRFPWPAATGAPPEPGTGLDEPKHRPLDGREAGVLLIPQLFDPIYLSEHLNVLLTAWAPPVLRLF